MTYDYKTPFRNEFEADYSAPTQFVLGRNSDKNIESTLEYWLSHKVPGMNNLSGLTNL